MAKNVSVNFKIDKANVEKMHSLLEMALEDTVEDICLDMVESETIPYDTGNTQENSSGVNKINNDEYEIYFENEYVERIYFEPLNFRKTWNKHAGNRWMDPYVDGKKSDFAVRAFAEHMKGKF